MEFDVSYSLENEQQFWDELEEIIAAPSDSHAAIDNILRSYLGLTTKYKDDYLHSEYDISRCSDKLTSSSLFITHADYIRRQIIYGLLQEDDPGILHVIASFLLFDARQNDGTFEMMNGEGVFVRLLELIQSPRRGDGVGGAGLHRLLMELLYEMSRIQRIKFEDLIHVDDDFVMHLFEIIEELSDDVNDPYHYPVIRVLLVLNEQFMVSAHDPVPGRSYSSPPTNKVIKVLSMHGNAYKTFGENIILLLNRESETSLQLLTLKLLYLLFTTPTTYEYFYTNDLRVLVDILIRNLLDLPEEAAALRHTYLRVLYPLLAHTQLRHPPHYKREELRKLLAILARGQFDAGEDTCEKILHFDEVDETTKRLVLRCGKVDWLVDAENEASEQLLVSESDPVLQANNSGADGGTSAEEETTPITATTTSQASILAWKLTKRSSSGAISTLCPKEARSLGMNLEPARSSSLSVLEVAAHKEKPGVITPSRKNSQPTAKPASAPKLKPDPPKARRWRGRREREEDEGGRRKIGGVDNLSGSPKASLPETKTSLDHAAESLLPHVQSVHISITTSSPNRVNSHPNTTATIPKAPTPSATLSLAPALPPPRRSSHSVPPPPRPPHSHPHSPNPRSEDHTPPTTANGQLQKPEPPKTRRWRGKQAQQMQIAEQKEGKGWGQKGEGIGGAEASQIETSSHATTWENGGEIASEANGLER